MQSLVGELAEFTGIRAAAVVTSDGITVASALKERFSEDLVAGLVSFLVSTTRRALSNRTPFGRMTMYATNGKLVISDVDGAYLACVVDQFAELDSVMTEIEDVARRVRRLSKIRI